MIGAVRGPEAPPRNPLITTARVELSLSARNRPLTRPLILTFESFSLDCLTQGQIIVCSEESFQYERKDRAPNELSHPDSESFGDSHALSR